MTAAEPASKASGELLATLTAIERRLVWLAVRIVDYANRERPQGDATRCTVSGTRRSSARASTPSGPRCSTAATPVSARRSNGCSTATRARWEPSCRDLGGHDLADVLG